MATGGGPHSLAGFESAFNGFFRGLSSWFAAKGVPREEAHDLAQDTIARAFVHIRRHGITSDDLWPLLRTIARNLYVERGRRPARRLVPIDEAAEVADGERSPDDLVVEADRRAALHSAIAELAPRHRRVIQLALGGRSAAEIARHLGIKRNAADALLHRARRSLAAKLEAVGSGLGAIFAPMTLRLRSLTRRGAELMVRCDPSGVLTSVMTTVGAAGLAAAVLASSGVAGEYRSHVGAVASAAVMGSASDGFVEKTVASSTARAARTVDDEGTRVGTTQTQIVTDVRRQHVRAQTKVDGSDGSEELDVGADVQGDPNSEPGISGRIVDGAVNVVCGQGGAGC